MRASLLYEHTAKVLLIRLLRTRRSQVRILTGRVQEDCYSGASSEPPGRSGLQQLSELREGHVVWDETFAATDNAFLRRVANDVSGVGNGLDEAPTAALLARQLDGDR
jgi:hypothetical protein